MTPSCSSKTTKEMNGISKTTLKSPIALKWTISAGELRKLKDKRGECLSTDWFKAYNIPGVQYSLIIYPNDDDEGKAGETWIYLELDFPDNMKIEADYKISIESANLCDILKPVLFDDTTKCWGNSYCATEELFDPEKGYIADGKLVIQMEGILTTQIVMAQKKMTPNDSHFLCVGLWKQEETKDFAFMVDDKEIRVHKNVLSIISPVFARMFESDMIEAKEGKTVIKDFTFEIVEKSIKSCYHKSLVPETSLEDAMKMLQFYDKYDIQPLKNQLEVQLITAIDSSNVCLLTNCSLFTNARKLEKRCAKFLHGCLKTKPIADFDLLDKEFALNLMKNAFFHVSSN